MRKNGKLNGWNETFQTSYFASKALLNCYGRFALPKMMKKNQSSYNIHPGWCRTDMGEPHAP